MKKPPTSMRREYSQAALARLASRQAEVHDQQFKLALELATVQKNLMAGWEIEPGPLYFDAETKLVRRRKASGE